MSTAPLTIARPPLKSASPTWWVVFQREFLDLWIGGKGFTLVLAYSLMLGLWSYILASNTELNLIPPKEMVWEMLEASISVSCFLVMIAAADNISGDRERGALEALLLTPTSRRQIVFGKFFAVLSLWPAVLAITVPYLAVLTAGTDVLGPAVLWGALTGTILVAGIGALGMAISLWSNTLKASMSATLGVFVLIFMPFSLPGHAQTGPMGLLLQALSPLMATFNFLAKILVNNRALTDHALPVGNLLVWHHLLSPVLFSAVTVLLLWLAGPTLRIEAGDRWKSMWGKVAVVAALFGALGFGAPRAAQAADPAPSAEAIHEQSHPIGIVIDHNVAIMTQGDSLIYTTGITNLGNTAAPPLTVALNIINLNSQGDVVDPEDWSPQRTQYIEELAPGQSTPLKWHVNAIMDGDYMLYMVAIPKPSRPELTSQPVASTGIHLTIKPFTKLNPKGILLYVVGTPLVLAIGMVYLLRRRRASVDRGGPPQAGM